MATRKFMSNKAPRKPLAVNRDRLECALEVERRKLMTAHSLLGCVLLAMDAQSEDGKPITDGPYLPEIVSMAMSKVDEVIGQLELGALQRG